MWSSQNLAKMILGQKDLRMIFVVVDVENLTFLLTIKAYTELYKYHEVKTF